MAVEIMTTKAILHFLVAVVTIVLPLVTVSFYIGKLSPRIMSLAHHEEEIYTTNIEKLRTFEKRADTIKGQLLGIQKEINDLCRLCSK